jgi:lysophospholipase L1-like esterase
MKILALGDSYTIGEGVSFLHNFPHQIATLLAQNNYIVEELTIVATTGWTTEELIGPMETQIKKNHYDWVTLLIGVNNQYRGRAKQEFDIHFAYILNRAIHFAQGDASKVIVLSIPDWGVTPFNVDRDKEQTSKEINEYNLIKQKHAISGGVHFIDITNSTRVNATNADYLALDGLHPSEKEYAIWAEKCFEIINNA